MSTNSDASMPTTTLLRTTTHTNPTTKSEATSPSELNRVSAPFSCRDEITGSVNDTNLQILLDTGANVSCISTNAFHRVNKDGRFSLLTPLHKSGTVANDSALTFTGRV
jgi:hypothetical protein